MIIFPIICDEWLFRPFYPFYAILGSILVYFSIFFARKLSFRPFQNAFEGKAGFVIWEPYGFLTLTLPKGGQNGPPFC